MLRCGELDVFVRVDGRQEKEGDGDGRGKVRWAETESQRCNFGTEPKTKNTLSPSFVLVYRISCKGRYMTLEGEGDTGHTT